MTAALRLHPDVARRDIPKLAAGCESPEAAVGLRDAINVAIQEVLEGRGVPTKEMDPPYRGWYRKKFHSTRRPPAGKTADLRLVYKWSPDAATLYILAIGRRSPGRPEDIYRMADDLDRRF